MPDLDDTALTDLLDLVFDAACARPIADLVDPARVLAALDVVADGGRLERWYDALFIPLRDRVLDHAARSSLTLGAWLPPDVIATLGELLGRPAPIPRRWIDDAVASEQVRDTVRTMLQETLSGFVAKATSGGGGEGSGSGSGSGGSSSGAGLGRALGWGARAVGAAGRGLFGGLSGELQKQLQDRVRDFVDGSVASLQARIAERLASEDTARELGQRRRAAFLGLLRQTEAQTAAAARTFPHAVVDPLVPRIARHNIARAELRAALVAEVTAVVTELSRRSLGETLDDLGLRSLAREALRVHGLPVARDLVATAAFGQWWDRVVPGGRAGI